MDGPAHVSVQNGTTLQTYDAATGKVAEKCTMKAGAKVGTSRTASRSTRGSELHLLTIATNRDRVVTTAKELGRPTSSRRALLRVQRPEAGRSPAASRSSRTRVENPCFRAYSRAMERARRHQRLLSGLAFGLLALVAELLGRSLTHRLDFGRHVAAPSYAHADYYPILLGV